MPSNPHQPTGQLNDAESCRETSNRDQLSHLTGEEVQITDLEAIYFASVLWADDPTFPELIPHPRKPVKEG